MSFHIYRIDRLADEKRLMEEKLKMESHIRKKREKSSRLKTIESEKYKRIFEPVTKSINAVQFPPPHQVLERDEPMMEGGYKVEEGKSERDYNAEEEEKPSLLYTTARRSIPRGLLDDGIFGLFITDDEKGNGGWIGNNTFHVNGNTLKTVSMEDGTVKTFVIDNDQLWKLLLVKSPNSIDLQLNNDEGKEALKEYQNIVEQLNLVQNAKGIRNYKNRAKFKMLSKKGTGFLFSTQPPPFHPSTVVIPSDKKGLLRALTKAVAELRAGNTSMQNIVVPLAQEAKRKKILPRKLLSPDEMTWVFA